MESCVDGCRNIVITAVCPPIMARRDVWKIDQFHLVKKIGSGYASTVYLATCRISGSQVAVKLYHKNKLSELNYFQVSREIRIHSSLDHRNIVQLWAAFEDQYGIYLVSEFASKGDVFADVEKRGGQMTEADTVRQVIHPFLLALIYLHDRNIMHRDIKPENLLLTSTGVLKVADFGLSINFESERPVTRVGTLDYMAPEVVVCPDKHKPSDNKELQHLYYTPVVDAWAVGVLAYELIIGRPPFDKGQKKLTIAEIINGEAYIPPQVSEGAASFIRWALTKDQHRRPTVHLLIEHSWVTGLMKYPVLKNPASLRLHISRHDSFSDTRSAFGMPEHQSVAHGNGSNYGPEEMVYNMQVQAIQQSGNMLGHSNSMNAADMLRWRDIAFNADPESSYGDVAAAAVAAMALAGKAGRKSDGGIDIGADGRRQSLSAAARMAVGCSPRLLTGGGISSPSISRNNSLLQPGGAPGLLSGNSFSMSREELFANLQASAQRLNRIGSFTQQQQQPSNHVDSRSGGGSSSAAMHLNLVSGSQHPISPRSSPTPQHPGLYKRSQSSSLVDSPPLSPSRMAPGRAPSGGGVSPDSGMRSSGDPPTSPHKVSGGGSSRPMQQQQQQQQQQVGLRGAITSPSGMLAPHQLMPSRLMSSSFSVPSSPMAHASGSGGPNRLAQFRPAPPAGPPSFPGGVSPRSSSFNVKSTMGGPAVGGNIDAMQPPVQMVVEGRDSLLGFSRNLDDEMDAIMSAAGGTGAPKGGLFGGMKSVFGS